MILIKTYTQKLLNRGIKMKVEEMIDKKKALQEEIIFQIQDFESDTGLKVTDIQLDRSYMFGPGEDGIITNVLVEVKLP